MYLGLVFFNDVPHNLRLRFPSSSPSYSSRKFQDTEMDCRVFTKAYIHTTWRYISKCHFIYACTVSYRLNRSKNRNSVFCDKSASTVQHLLNIFATLQFGLVKCSSFPSQSQRQSPKSKSFRFCFKVSRTGDRCQRLSVVILTILTALKL
jgi:hypothetical protein